MAVDNVIYDIVNTSTGHYANCNEVLCFQKEVGTNPIASISNGNIDNKEAAKHMEAIILSNDNVETYYWLTKYIAKGDSFKDNKFSPNPSHDMGHYIEGKVISSYTQYFVEDVIQEYIVNKVMSKGGLDIDTIKEAINRDFPFLLPLEEGSTFVYDGTKYTTVTFADGTTDWLLTDKKISGIIKDTIKVMTKAYGDQLCEKSMIEERVTVELSEPNTNS